MGILNLVQAVSKTLIFQKLKIFQEVDLQDYRDECSIQDNLIHSELKGQIKLIMHELKYQNSLNLI